MATIVAAGWMHAGSQRQHFADPGRGDIHTPLLGLHGLPAMNTTVVEINPHAPRPWVFSAAALCLQQALRRAGHVAGLRHNAPPGDGSILLVLGWSPAWLAEHAASLDPRHTVLCNLEPATRALSATATPADAAWLAEFGHWVVADAHGDNLDSLRSLPPDGAWHGGTSGAALRAALWVLPPCAVPGPTSATPTAGGDTSPVDVIFVGTPSPRRESVLQALRAAGCSVLDINGAYAWELTPQLLRARLLLHVHNGDDRHFPVERVLQPVALAVPVLCESSIGAAAQTWRDQGIAFADHADLVPAALRLLAEPGLRLSLVQQALRTAQAQSAAPLVDELQRLLASMPAPASAPLDTQIDRALLREAGALPPAADERPPPVVIAQNEPGRRPASRVFVVLMVLFTLVMLWQFAWRR